MPRVSVIIPAYNHDRYVAEAIQSVLDQTYQDFEIIITDDGSTDRTVDEIKKFKDPRIRLFVFEQNEGAPAATTNCVRESRGEYLAMLSSDDAYLPPKLEKQVRFLDGHPDVWAVFGYARIIDEDGKDFSDPRHFYSSIFKQPNRTRFEWLRHFFYNGNCLCHPSVLARRECYKTLGSPDPRYAQLGDFYRWIKTCFRHEIHIIPEDLVKFRIRAGEANASGGRPEAMRRTYFEFSSVFRYYLGIGSAEEFSRIFPEAEQYGRVENELIPYFLARLAIDNRKFYPVHQYVGISILYDLLGDSAMAGSLGKKCGFRHRDFIRLTGEFDLFGWESQQESESLKQKLAEKDKQIAALLNSASWKVTAPLRKVASMLEGSD
jgi:glycosyltransferase involved in cell wall biosynthesis